ncbi:MAG: c-type cytochrome [Boseongicola sp.]|nr:c-type cytochrome [Boseongicola sp.]
MSKSLNLFLPAAGGTALVLGAAYGIATSQYADSAVDSMSAQIEIAEAEAAKATEAATAELARATELEMKALEIQDAARRQLAAASGGSVSEPAPRSASGYGLGRKALPEEIAAWDIDVLPDGRGLPKGSGDVFTGEEVFAEKCASCHGDFAEGVDNWPVLAGGFDTLADKDPVKTVGSYWPYLSTVWDYVHRSMPFGAAQTVTADETYAIVAYILYSNDVVGDDFELSHENFLDVQMHNATGFIVDDRADTEYSIWRSEPCMENCKDSVEITMRASVLDVTPEDEGADAAEEQASATEEATSEPTVVAAVDPELIKAGEKTFKRCASCHAVGAGAKNKSGPQLNNLIGRTMGGVDGFKYSDVFKAAAAEGRVWDEESLGAFLTKPKAYMKGTKMAFSGFKSQDDIDAIVAYLKAQTGG